MKQTKYLKCACQHCGGRIEFPAEVIGQFFDCPHCLHRTELTLPPPPEPDTPELATKSRTWLIAGIIILLIGVAGSAIAMTWLKRVAARKQRQQTTSATARTKDSSAQPAIEDPAAVNTNSLTVSRIAVDKPRGSTLMYATGRVKNQSDRQRFGVKVELDLFDRADVKIGTASDYLQVLEPRAVWQFRALVIEPKAVSAKLAAIKEDQ